MASKRQRGDKVTASAGKDAVHGVWSSSPHYLSISLICLFLVLSSAVVYWQVKDHQFISFDDPIYVTVNSHVVSGLSMDNVKWAFGHSMQGRMYWHPLTWIFHMFDVQLWGLDAGMHHLTNLFLHIANALLLFFVLRSMTGAVWKSAFVAALFALHPINVDTVAWISERKNLLSTFFWLLVMAAYFHYSKHPDLRRYVLVLICFVLGLLAKPMLVTLPFVLLLLDYWPLGRITFLKSDGAGSSRLLNYMTKNLRLLIKTLAVLDKIPLIFISLVSIWISALSLKFAGNIISSESVPMGLRISNALVSYVMYIWKMIWPMNLAIHYPFPSAIPAWQVIGASVLLISVTSAVFVASSRHPYLSVGWLWYIVTLLPVSGIVQGGVWPAMADRWAYVPLIGVYIMVSWGAPELVSRWRFKKIALTASVGIVLSILTVTSWIQAGYWMNSITLFEHALKVTDKNDIAHINLGAAFMEAGNLDGAIKHYEEAASINPDANIYNILGKAMAEKGNENEAIRYFSRSIELNPSDARIHSILAMSLLKQGNVREAVEHYRRALELKPGLVDVHNGLGVALARKGDMDGAIHGFQEALRIEPGNISALSNVAMVYGGRGDYDKALDALRKIIQVQPGSPGAYYNIACIYARQGKVDESVRWLKTAVKKGFNDWGLLKEDKDLENIRKTVYYGELMRLHGNG